MNDRFDGLTKLLGRRGAVAGAAASVAALAQRGFAAAQDTASAGNGGTAVAGANGGAVSIGDVNSGFNGGGFVGVGDVWDGSVAVDGGDVSSSTSIGISADGGVAIADASGGDDNVAVTNDFVFVS